MTQVKTLSRPSLSSILEYPFSFKNNLFWSILFLLLLLRLFWASSFPMGNDEVYYWDWSRNLQLSYIDAPPFVAWIAYAGRFFFDGSIGARFFVPIIHTISALFLVLSTKLFFTQQNLKIKTKHVFLVLIFFEFIPAYNLEGFMLLPDSSLLLGIAGAYYFLLKAIVTGENKPLTLRHALMFGFFLGCAALSKYHALPIAIGFFLSSFLIRGKALFIKDIPFWTVAILSSIIVASPVFIWNIQNNFASFRFQSDHGFSGMSFNYQPFLRYLLGMILYLLPWFFYIFGLFVYDNLRKKNYTSLNILSILPFLILFVLIFISALGKQALPHWALPGFILLIPPLVAQWDYYLSLSKYKRYFNSFFIVSATISLIIPTISSLKSFQNFVINSFVYFRNNADPLSQVFEFQILQQELFNQQKINIKTSSYVTSSASNSKCEAPYIVGSLRWFWGAQLAYNLKNQPKVYNFDFNSTSFYSWRDDFAEYAGCPVLIIGNKDHYNLNELTKAVSITKVTETHIAPYTGIELVIVEGILKTKSELKDAQKILIENIKY